MQYRFTSAALMMALLIFPGTCKKKKPDVPPPQATAPTQTQPQQPQQQQAPTANTEPTQKAEETKTEQTPATTTTPAKPKPKPHTATTKKPQPEMKRPTPPASATAPKPTTPQPTTNEPGQLTASVSNMEAARKRQETAQLLALTDGELKGITRTLDRDEQNIVLQIRGYMQQAQIADKDGDLDRARNLAVKAKLLADDLVKPK